MGMFSLPAGDDAEAYVRCAIENLEILLPYLKDNDPNPPDYLLDFALTSIERAREEIISQRSSIG